MRSVVDENIDALSRAILSDAQAEVDQILAEGKAKADTIRQQAQGQAEGVRKEILDRATQEAQRLRGQIIATTQLKARTAQLDHREKMLDKVFLKVSQDLASVLKWTDYEEIAKNLLREALTQLKASQAVIRADPQTMKLLSDSYIHQISDEFHIEIRRGEPLSQGTGVIVEAENGKSQYDNTLETRLERMKSGLRSPVYHLLMGEAL